MAVDSNPKLSAVLVLFYPFDNHPHVVLMQRNSYKGVHSAQVSFPGGKLEPNDQNLQHTALREAHEELNIVPDEVDVLGQLTEVYIPPSGFLVEPYMGLANTRPNLQPNPHEVQQIIEVPVADLMNTQNRMVKPIKLSNGFTIEAPCYQLSGHIVWGATAMMLGETCAILERAGL